MAIDTGGIRAVKSRAWAILVVVILGGGSYLGYGYATRLSAQRALHRAQVAFQLRDWTSVRIELGKYLQVFSADESARLNLAEAYFKDATLNSVQAVSLAIRQLRHIPRESSLWPAARVQEARLTLFSQLQPHRAESLLHELLAIHPQDMDANYVLWKLYDLTGRSHLAEPHFRTVLAATPEEQRPFRLREWYLSQFYPATANPELDQLMGFHEPGEVRNAVTELRRLKVFRDHEPQAAVNHAIVARWYSLEGDPKSALRILQEALDVADKPLQDPFFVATLIQVLFDLGEFDNAWKYFRSWPGERAGYEYARLGAILADEVERDYARALENYRQVISIWPGQADWRIQYRLARCLAKFGDEQASQEMTRKAKEVELLMEEAVHSPLRRMLVKPDQLEICQRMTQFYEQLGLEFEVKHWRDQVQRLQNRSDRPPQSARSVE